MLRKHISGSLGTQARRGMDRFLSSYTATRLRLQLLRNGLSKVLKDPTARIEAQFGTKASKPKAQGGKKKGPPASGAGASPVAAPAAADAKGGKKKFRVAAVEETPRLRRSDLPSEPVLPAEGRDNILITSALPYVNNVPHLGNLIGCVLSADVYARWCRQRGLNALYICGTDEYGTATETKAREEGLTPREVCDKYHAKHKAIYDWFDIRFDYFGRTSHATPKDSKGWPQTDIGQEIFTDCLNAGNLLEKSSQQVFCAGCDKFLSDRLVEGICPNCGHEDARGDQCPSCDALLNATDLKSPRCMVDKAHKLEVRDTEHMYLDLPKQDERLRAWLNKCFESGRWTSNAVSITQNWLKAGLQPRPITRDLKWGTPVPMEKFSDKVFYVWFDAPIGYISMTSCYLQDRGLDAGAWKAWWQNPDRVRLVQFMGKDNVPFHSVVFPGSLIATEKKWTLVGDLSVTEYLQYESGRFSKSKGVGVFGDTAKETGIPSEVWRFYLLSQRPENSDTEFSWSDFADNVNNVLLKNLGNFVNRALNLSYTQFEGAVPGIKAAPGDREAALETRVNQLLAEYNEYVGKQKLRHALGLALLVSGEGNTYLQDKAPWDLKKQGKMDESATAIAYSVSLVRLVAAIFEPYMPGFTDRVCHQLGLPHMDIPDKFEVCVPEGHKLGMKPRPIFTQIQPEQVEEWRSRFGGSEAAAGGAVSASDASKGKAKKAKGKGKGGAAGGGAAGGGKKKKGADRSDVPAFSRLLLKVGQITKVWEHPEKDRLFCEEVDVGEGEPRTIASGLREHYKLEELQGRKIVVVANLKDRKMGDFTSKGMVLCANKGDRVEFVDPPAGSAIGERVIIDGTEADADEKINPQKKKNPWKDVVPELSTDGDKQACYAGKPLRTAAGVCTVPSLDGATLS